MSALELLVRFCLVKFALSCIKVLQDMSQTPCVAYPFQDPAIFAQRSHCKGSQVKIPSSGIMLSAEDPIQQGRELHHAQILAQIILRLAEECLFRAIATHHR